MLLKTFNAPDMNAAKEMVREMLGEEAVIISTARTPGGKGVSITAALDRREEQEMPTPAPTQPFLAAARLGGVHGASQDKERLLRDIDKVLRFHSTPDYLIDSILETARYVDFEPVDTQEGIREAIEKILDANLRFEPVDLTAEPKRLMLIGPPGVGKTVTIAKLATQLSLKKEPFAVITTDTSRAGGLEQLAAFTNILKADLLVADTPQQLHAIVAKAHKNMHLLIDTAGVNPYELEELKALKSFLDIEGLDVLLTLPAGMDWAEAEDITRSFGFLGVRKLLVTRMDTARRFGSVLTSAHLGDLALCQMCESGRVTDAPMPLSAAELSRLLMQHRVKQ